MRTFNLLSRLESWMEGLSSRIRLVFLSYAGSESLVPVTSRRTELASKVAREWYLTYA